MSFGRIAVFLLVMTSVLGGGHYYLYVRLVRDTGLTARWARAGKAWLGGMPVLLVVGLAFARGPRAVVAPLSWLVYVWLGLFFFLVLAVLATDVLRLGIHLAGYVAPSLRDPSRRRFVSRVLGGAAALAGVGLSSSGLASVLSGHTIERVRVRLAGLGRPGYRIVQLTDVHVGPTIDREFVRRVVEQVNALEPDAVVITGDLVDGSVEELRDHVAPLKDLRAKDGVFFVTGNHEYYSGADAWIAHLGTLGVRVLRNEHVVLGGDRGFVLAGVDDFGARAFGNGHGQDVPKALAGRDPSLPLVLLAHQPRTALEAAKHGVALVLSGHTHGGQMVPWNQAVKLQQPFVAGLYQHEGTHVYVSRGTGYWGPPMRVGAPAEITHIELSA
jgi:predicted MPP superfamily phosphohydrolase